MFEIQMGPAGEVVMAGRLDATQCDAALKFLEPSRSCESSTSDGLNISPARDCGCSCWPRSGIKGVGTELKLINACPQIHDIFRYAGFDRIIDISRAPA